MELADDSLPALYIDLRNLYFFAFSSLSEVNDLQSGF